MRRTTIGLCVAALGLLLCMSCRKDGKSEISRAAETYYGYLIEGKYADYVGAIAYSDSMTDEYRSQMVDLVAQYAAREREARGGLVAAKALDDTVSGDVGSVFIEVLFGDSTREEVSLPMVRCGEVWKMQ